MLRRAIELSAQAQANGDQPFGSLLATADGAVLAEAVNTTITDRDISAHPELKLAVWAARNLAAADSRDVTLYTSCENCPMCATAMVRSGLRRLVYALGGDQLQALRGPSVPTVPIGSREIFERAGVDITVVGPVLPEEAVAVHHGHWTGTVP